MPVIREKKIKSIVQSVSTTMHSYTVQPTVSADGYYRLFLLYSKKLVEHLVSECKKQCSRHQIFWLQLQNPKNQQRIILKFGCKMYFFQNLF